MWPAVSAHGIARHSKTVPMIAPQQTSPAGLSSRQAGPAAGCGAGFRAGFGPASAGEASAEGGADAAQGGRVTFRGDQV